MSNSCQQKPTNSWHSYNPARNILLIPGESSNNGNASGPVTNLLRHGVTMQASSLLLLSLSKFSTLILCALILSALSFAAAPDRIAGAIVSSQTVALPAGVHYKAQPQFDQAPLHPSLNLNPMTLLTFPSTSHPPAINHLPAPHQ